MTTLPQGRAVRVTILAIGLGLSMTGCEQTVPNVAGPGKGGGFKTQYLAARAALDGGKYTIAAKRYAKVVDKAGPMTGRVRIELAHALLRDGKYEDAAREASRAASSTQGLEQAAAKALQATAEHELALARIGSGKNDRVAYDLTASALGLFGEIDDWMKDLDPQGGLAGRRANIKADHKRLKATLGL